MKKEINQDLERVFKQYYNVLYTATHQSRMCSTNCSMRCRKNTMQSKNAKTAASKITMKKSAKAIRKTIL